MDLNQVLETVRGLIDTQANLHNQAIAEIKTKGAVPSELREKLDKVAIDAQNLTNVYNDAKSEADGQKQRVSELEAKIKDFEKFGLQQRTDEQKSIAERFIDSEEFKECVASRRDSSRKFAVGSFFDRKDIISAGNTGILTDAQRLAGITQIPNVPLTIRTLLPSGRTSNNMIEYVKEGTFTNNAGPQYSPASPTNVFDGAKKNKSDLTWTLVQRPVSTIAHYMKASRQILDDAPMLQSEINNRLLYGLALEEEEQLLLGDGTNGNQLGIIPQAAAYNTALNVADDTKIDKIRHALLQVTLSKYLPTAIVLAPKDWHDIELTKTEEGGANKGSYVLSNPAAQTEPRLWGYRVVPSLSMTAGNFLVGNFATGAQIFDRMSATIEVARQNEDDFVRNMISILAEERLALAVYNGNSFVEGDF